MCLFQKGSVGQPECSLGLLSWPLPFLIEVNNQHNVILVTKRCKIASFFSVTLSVLRKFSTCLNILEDILLKQSKFLSMLLQRFLRWLLHSAWLTWFYSYSYRTVLNFICSQERKSSLSFLFPIEEKVLLGRKNRMIELEDEVSS